MNTNMLFYRAFSVLKYRKRWDWVVVSSAPTCKKIKADAKYTCFNPSFFRKVFNLKTQFFRLASCKIIQLVVGFVNICRK